MKENTFPDIPAIIEENIIKDTPLDIPFSVINSQIHISNTVHTTNTNAEPNNIHLSQVSIIFPQRIMFIKNTIPID